MKKLLSLLLIITVISVSLFSQTPNQFKYQAVLRNADGTIMAEENVTMVISILKSDLTTSVFKETHATTTTAQGLINLDIGSIEDLSAIDWSIDTYYIEISVNGTAIGTSQLLSVPYALHSKTAEAVSSYTETDPIFDASIAAGITTADTTSWNDKSEFDGDFTSLYNAPNMANTTYEKNIHLNTNDATSSLNITKNNGASVLKVDGTGRITGDGSGLSNVKPLINYTGGDHRYQITANYGSYNNVRSVTMTAPSSGVCFVMASGYVDWESTGWDLLLAGILCDQDPNSSWNAENEWYDYLNIITDYNCTDSSDQYTSFSQHRCIPVSAGTHTFYLWANKYSAAAKTEVADVNISVMFFPTGGTGKSSKDSMIKEEELEMVIERIPNTVAGYK